MERATQAVKDVIEAMAEEWHAKSSAEIRSAINNNEWVEFEVAQALRNDNYTLVPIDFYERIAKAVIRSLCDASRMQDITLTSTELLDFLL